MHTYVFQWLLEWMRGALPNQPDAVLKKIAKTYQNAKATEIASILDKMISEEVSEANAQPTSPSGPESGGSLHVTTDGGGATRGSVAAVGPRHQIFHREISDNFNPSDPVDMHVRYEARLT